MWRRISEPITRAARQNCCTKSAIKEEGRPMSNPVEALIQDWRERGRRREPTRHKAIRRGDGGAADIYDAEQRALFACADELASALASLRSSPEVETLIAERLIGQGRKQIG